MTKSVILIGLVLLVTFIQITELRGIRGSRGRSYRRPRPRPTYERARQNAYSGVHVDPPTQKKDLYDPQRLNDDDYHVARPTVMKFENTPLPNLHDIQQHHKDLQRPNDDYHVARPTVMKFEYRSTPLPKLHATTRSRHAHEMESLRRRVGLLILATMRYARANRTANPERRHLERKPPSLNSTRSQHRTEASRLTETKIGAASRTNKSSVFFNRTESPVNDTEPSLKNGLKTDESTPRFDDDDSRTTDPVTVNETEPSLKNGLKTDESTPRFDDDSRTTDPVTEKCSRLYIQDPPCRAATKNWYYDSSLKRCIRGICGFRDNLFTTKRECLERCM